MPILDINPDYTGQVGILPRTVKVICNDNYATVTSAGYLNSSTNQGFNYYPTDVFFVSYLNNAFGIFQPTFSGNLITLVNWVNPGSVALSGNLVAGNVVEALNANTIEDGGAALSALQRSSNIRALSYNYGGGSTTVTIPVTGVTTSSVPFAGIWTSTNPAVINTVKILSAGQLTVVFSADPGVSTVLNILVFIAPQ